MRYARTFSSFCAPWRYAALVAFALTFSVSSAHAQLHWDASLQAGAMKRVLIQRPAGTGDSGIGPAVQAQAHVALLPLIRLGGYLGYEISPVPDASARDLGWGGLRAKIMSPWPRGALRAWLFVGLGYARAYTRSTPVVRDFPGAPGTPSVPRPALVHGASGGFFEVPFGIGASYKLRKPWEICAELGARAGFAHHGSVYELPGPRLTSDGQPDTTTLPAGLDRFAIGLTVGVLADL